MKKYDPESAYDLFCHLILFRRPDSFADCLEDMDLDEQESLDFMNGLFKEIVKRDDLDLYASIVSQMLHGMKLLNAIHKTEQPTTKEQDIQIEYFEDDEDDATIH